MSQQVADVKMYCCLCNDECIAAEGEVAEVWEVSGWHCYECIDTFTWWLKSQQGTTNGAYHEANEVTPWHTAPASAYYSISTCSHNLTPLAFPDGTTLYLSGRSHIRDAAQGPEPQAVVYLDSWWTDNLILTNDGTNLQGDGPAVLKLAWPDMREVPLDELSYGVEWIERHLLAGDNIEIGCMGGHGRTGSLAAAVLVGRGWDAWRAAFYVRSYYCPKAIETAAQEKMLVEYDTRCNGREYENHSS